MKTLCEKEKLLVTSNFSFSHVFKSCLLLMRQNEYPCSKGLNYSFACSPLKQGIQLILKILIPDVGSQSQLSLIHFVFQRQEPTGADNSEIIKSDSLKKPKKGRLVQDGNNRVRLRLTIAVISLICNPAKPHSLVSSVQYLRTGHWLDPGLGQYSFLGLMIVIARGFILLSLLSHIVKTVDSIESRMIPVHRFNNVGKQPVVWKEYCVEDWL